MKNILFVASECVPFIKTGGLADVVGSLPKYFPKEYFDVRVVIPKYAGIKEQFKNQMQYVTNFYMDLNWRQQYVGIFEMEYEGIKFYFIDNEEHFGGSTPYAGMPWDLEKFAYFSKAALSILPTIGFRPDLIHCHDCDHHRQQYIRAGDSDPVLWRRTRRSDVCKSKRSARYCKRTRLQ